MVVYCYCVTLEKVFLWEDEKPLPVLFLLEYLPVHLEKRFIF